MRKITAGALRSSSMSNDLTTKNHQHWSRDVRLISPEKFCNISIILLCFSSSHAVLCFPLLLGHGFILMPPIIRRTAIINTMNHNFMSILMFVLSFSLIFLLLKAPIQALYVERSTPMTMFADLNTWYWVLLTLLKHVCSLQCLNTEICLIYMLYEFR